IRVADVLDRWRRRWIRGGHCGLFPCRWHLPLPRESLVSPHRTILDRYAGPTLEFTTRVLRPRGGPSRATRGKRCSLVVIRLFAAMAFSIRVGPPASAHRDAAPA